MNLKEIQFVEKNKKRIKKMKLMECIGVFLTIGSQFQEGKSKVSRDCDFIGGCTDVTII